MTVRYKIDPETDVIYVGLTGVVRDAELQYTVDTALRKIKQHNEVTGLVDLRAIKRFEVSEQAIQHLVEEMHQHQKDEVPSWKAAVIAPFDAVPGVKRMNQLLRLAPAENLGIFLKVNAARKWLGLPPEEVNT